jgi:hypothetical protein
VSAMVLIDAGELGLPHQRQVALARREAGEADGRQGFRSVCFSVRPN